MVDRALQKRAILIFIFPVAYTPDYVTTESKNAKQVAESDVDQDLAQDRGKPSLRLIDHHVYLPECDGQQAGIGDPRLLND